MPTAPEVRLFRHQYQFEFERALKAELASLQPAERELMRLHFIDGLSMHELSVLHRGDRSTIFRHITATRNPEIDALATLMQSQFDTTLSGVIRDAD
jgi:RNA polymerase sigma-70 factor (ECF subfamily)